MPANPFSTASPLPLHYPPFDRIRDADFAPAFDAGMAEQLAEIRAIAADPAAPTLANTVLAMERSGQVLERATTVFFGLEAADTNEARKQLRADYAARLAAQRDTIYLDPALFERIRTLYENRHSLAPDAEDLRLLERYHTDFLRAGARLDLADKARLTQINAELAALGAQFSQNVLDEVNASGLVVDDVAELAGLTDAQLATAADEAKSRALAGKYVIGLLNTTGQPLEAQLTRRDVRQRLHETSVARGSRGGPFDNREIISRIMTLRAERAALLGYPNHAAYGLAEQMARTPDAVNALLGKLAPAAVANAKREASELQEMIRAEGGDFALAPWDWAYYAEKLRVARYSFDEAQIKPYFELRSVIEDGVFFAASRLYGLSFKRRTDLPVYHPDVMVYEVTDRDGALLALFLADVYARKSKRGGAWMNSYVSQSALTGHRSVVANHLNIPKPPPGEPTLLAWFEVVTAFHEFGHALHGMFSDVKYPYFSGTRVPRDFVEFPSQLNEMWADDPQVLGNYARHHRSGAPMPRELLDKILAASLFNQGHATTEYLGAALFDQRWHQLAPGQVPAPDEVMTFEAAALSADGIDYPPVPPRYRTPYFSHIMGGYAAGYYAYIWSELLGANTEQWFARHGGLQRGNGDLFRAAVLARGGAADAMSLFRDFFGGDPQIAPLLAKRGLA